MHGAGAVAREGEAGASPVMMKGEAAAREGEAGASPVISDEAAALHERALVWDAHMDALLRALVEGYDLGGAAPRHADLDRWRAGGVNAQVLALWVDTIYVPHHAAHRALQQADVLFTGQARNSGCSGLRTVHGTVFPTVAPAQQRHTGATCAADFSRTPKRHSLYERWPGGDRAD